MENWKRNMERNGPGIVKYYEYLDIRLVILRTTNVIFM